MSHILSEETDKRAETSAIDSGRAVREQRRMIRPTATVLFRQCDFKIPQAASPMRLSVQLLSNLIPHDRYSIRAKRRYI